MQCQMRRRFVLSPCMLKHADTHTTFCLHRGPLPTQIPAAFYHILVVVCSKHINLLLLLLLHDHRLMRHTCCSECKLAAFSTLVMLRYAFTLVLQKHSREDKRTQGSNKQGGQVEPETKPGAYNK